MHNIKFIIFYVILFTTIIYGQNNYNKKYIKIAPGPEYEAGWLHKLILGEHWRKLWITPIEVEVLDLNKFAGGLTPLKRGGGFQTKSLRLTGNDGNIWKFRSMKKDPSKVLPEILRNTVVADVFQDQISSANPLAALVAAPILTSVNILQAKPYLVYMPDDPKLGKFRKDFGGKLGMIEIHPDIDEEKNREFKGADKIKSTFKLFERLTEKRKERVDANNYLKARLIDIFLGDWDRHTDQWKWAGYKKGDFSYWEPIPRDRDQVFAKWDGIGPGIAAVLVPQFVHFDYDFPAIEDITWSGRYIDRRFLTEITEYSWDSVTTLVVKKLTNDVIENAVSKLPKEHFDIAGKELIEKLKSRRNLLTSYSKKYYKMINKVVDIYGTEKDDIIEVIRLNNKQTSVELYDLKKKTNKKNILYHKVFNNSITTDIRVRLLDGDDKAVIKGVVDSSPLIRVIGGPGKDKLIDSSKVNGYLLGLLPILNPECKTEFYDSGKKTKLTYGAKTYFNNKKLPKPKNEFEKYEPALRDRGSFFLLTPILKFNSNDGLSMGVSAQGHSYNFRMDPYEFSMNLSAYYSTRPQSFSAGFNGIYNSIIKGATITLDIVRSELLFTNYYGFGNETTFDKKLEETEFYRIDEDLFSIKSAIHLNYFGNISGNLGLGFYISELDLNNDDLLNSFKNSYGLNDFNLLEVFGNFKLDTRDGTYFTENGFYTNLNISYFPKLMDNKKSFFKTEAFAAFFTTLNTFTDFTFALKAGGGIVLGDYPFFESIFIGGADNLRGYSRRRFAGNAGLYGQFELRTYLFPLKIIVPGKFGVHGFIESGRVYDDVYKYSDKWHPSYGGGVWITFVNNSISGSFSAAKSIETTAYYINLGMGF